MEYNSNVNNFYPSYNQNENYFNENKNDNQNQNSQSNKYFKINETLNEFYIKNNKNNKSIKIYKTGCNKDNGNKEIINTYQADSIIGIYEINDKKYLAIVTSSKVAAKLLNSFIFKIIKVDLIKMTNEIETNSDIKLREEIENLFATQNFYYSNEYDLSLSLYSQYLINSYDFDGNNNNKKKLESKYLINSENLKYFVENNIPDFFYSIVIFGYVGCKIDVNLEENREDITADLILIERYYKKNIIINKDIPEHIKQIEFICTFKDKYNQNNNNTFSFIFYVNSKSLDDINEFSPFNNFLKDELDKYKNATYIINNLNNYNKNNILKEKISNINQNFLNNKIKLSDMKIFI